jgi:hypothetical protein
VKGDRELKRILNQLSEKGVEVTPDTPVSRIVDLAGDLTVGELCRLGSLKRSAGYIAGVKAAWEAGAAGREADRKRTLQRQAELRPRKGK